MHKFSLDNEIFVEMVEGAKEISTRMREDLHLLGAIMATIILKKVTTFKMVK